MKIRPSSGALRHQPPCCRPTPLQVSTPSSMTQLVADEQEALKDLVRACCPGLGAPGSPEAKAAEAAAAAGLGTVSGWCSSVGRAVTYDLRQW